MSQPCAPLITPTDVTGCCSDTEGADPTLVENMADAASQIAWALSGRRYGPCDVTGERPGRINDKCCPVSPCVCGCRKPSTLFLAHPPVTDVVEVRIAGEVVEDWMLQTPNRLVRLWPERWPACQMLDADPTADDVVTVDYTWGLPVDPFGVMAISAYACELVKDCLGKPCSLPERVTSSVTRQGVSFVIESGLGFLDEGRTGVPMLDQWLASVNPNHLARRSVVRTPDILTGA